MVYKESDVVLLKIKIKIKILTKRFTFFFTPNTSFQTNKYSVETNFVCPRCGNSNPKYIGFIHKKPYCRFCIGMNGEKAPSHVRNAGAVVLDLKYPLTSVQEEISKKLLQNYKKGIDTLINAVCGAGKTELVYRSIEYFINQGKRVAFAIPRKDVVIEIYERLKVKECLQGQDFSMHMILAGSLITYIAPGASKKILLGMLLHQKSLIG